MRPRLMFRLLPVLLLASFVSTCGGNLPPNATPQMKVAKYGGDLIESIKVLASTTSDLEAQKVLPTPSAAQIMILCNKAGESGRQLSDLLTAYDLATNKQSFPPLIEDKLKVIDSLMSQALTAAGQEPAAKQISALIQKVAEVIKTIRQAVPTVPPAVPQET